MKRTRIPYGYEIIEGKACIHAQRAQQLRQYFSGYLAGLSMRAAAREAQLPVSPSTLPHLLARREYCGTDYYPQMITAAYQKELLDEYNRRREHAPSRASIKQAKRVRLCTGFKLSGPAPTWSGDPVRDAAACYQRIHPKRRTRKSPHRQTDNRQTDR